MQRLIALLAGLSLAACSHTPAPADSSVPPAVPSTVAARQQLSATERAALASKAEALTYDENKPAEALPLYRQLWDLGEHQPNILYNAACAASLAGQTEEGLQWLERAADAGWGNASHLAKDPDLAALRDAPGFARVAAKVQAIDDKKNAAREPALRDEILKRVEVDQEARHALFANGQKPTPEKLERLKQIDQENTQWLKGVLAKHGWPGKTLVGERASKGVWLLVQHADLDRPFQKECLTLLEKAVVAGEAQGQDFAYLTDRVRVGEGKPQRFGTQFTNHEGVMVPSPIEDEANVDARRASVGLGTLEEYAAQMQRTYNKPTSARPLPIKK
ncbi:MAG TPA: DUF6624 domain-containing protein [Myxococcus sp.]|nr:DUF6624 domain-containing protein [Myxococcus sp.]